MNDGHFSRFEHALDPESIRSADQSHGNQERDGTCNGSQYRPPSHPLKLPAGGQISKQFPQRRHQKDNEDSQPEYHTGDKEPITHKDNNGPHDNRATDRRTRSIHRQPDLLPF